MAEIRDPLPTELSPEQIRELGDGELISHLLDGLQMNFQAYCRLFTPLAGKEMRQDGGVTWLSAGRSAPGDHVLACNLKPGEEEAELQAVLAQFSVRSERVDWPIYRCVTPKNLGRRLTRLGLRQGQVLWMLAELDQLTPGPGQADFQIKRVQDLDELEQWQAVSAAGFEIPPQVAQIYRDAYARQDLDDRTLQHHIGYWRGQAVTSSTLLLTQKMAGLYDISTPPLFRRRGFGTAITRALLAEARAQGCVFACLMASPLGEGIYEQAGFATRITFAEYCWENHA